ncbi:MAG: putative bifunctional diguanylate cyclase/phosphodiesterase, partial [Vulcanimicrobiaceae bacterium]
IDLRSGDVRWSTELYRIAGVDQASGEPRPLWEFGRKDEFAGAVEVLVQARIDGRAYSLEHRIETIDGDERILVERGRYLFEPGASEPHRLIGAVVDISEQRSAEERLRYLAQHDELTGLPNRALLADSLRAALVRRVPERWVAVVAIDLDRFTAINDGHTHALGDRVLRETAERLRRALDRHGTLARPAADEFVAIVEDIASEADARAAAERLRTAVGEPHALEGLEIVVTASLGIALAPRDGAAPAELFGAADAAMHAVKALGGDGIAVFSGDLRARRRGSHVRERALRDALEHGALEVAYQPIVAARSGRISGFEALVRWEDEGRAIEPNEFVALAESTGLIGRLGSFVLEGVVQRLAQLAARGRDELSIAVNISAHQLQTRNFVAELGALLAQHAIEPARLHIEITESAYITGEAGVHNVRALADLGVAISIDDFGTGYSSLGYLKLLPVDALKIDRSFITEILEDPADRAIVGAIVAVARHLGLAVIAEGVESAAQARYLQRAGCTHLQGYHFARPLVGHEFEVLVASDFVLPGSQAV